MRIHSAAFFLTAFAATGASAASIVSLDPSADTPSIVTLANTAVDASIVEASPLVGPPPSIVALADAPADDMPDVLSLGGPAPADGGKPEDPQGMTMPARPTQVPLRHRRRPPSPSRCSIPTTGARRPSARR
jgi:hypothetical protein